MEDRGSQMPGSLIFPLPTHNVNPYALMAIHVHLPARRMCADTTIRNVNPKTLATLIILVNH